MPTGTVKWFKNEKGHGRIAGDDGNLYFVGVPYIAVEGYKTLKDGQRVSFECTGEYSGPNGMKGAENVRPL